MRVGIYSLGGCEGCRYELIRDILRLSWELGLEIAYEPLLGLNKEQPFYDLVLVEGAVCTLEDAAKLMDLRKRSRCLVALGTCATLGGIPGNKRFADRGALFSVYMGGRLPKSPEEVKPLSAYVKVDYWVRGCPPTQEEFEDILRKIALGISFKQHERRLEYCREKAASIEGSMLRLRGEKCIACGRCVSICEKIGVNAIDYAYRGINVSITTPFNMSFDESTCISCGLCTAVCPVGAIHEKSSLEIVQRRLSEGSLRRVYVEPESLAALSILFDVSPGIIAGALVSKGFEEVVVWRPGYRVEPRMGAIIPMSGAERILVEKFFPNLVERLRDPPKPPDEDACLITPCLARKLGIRGDLILTTREAIRLLSATDFEGVQEEEMRMMIGDMSGEVIRAVGPEMIYGILSEVSNGSGDSRRNIELRICPGGCLYGGGQPLLELLEEGLRSRLERRYGDILGLSPPVNVERRRD